MASPQRVSQSELKNRLGDEGELRGLQRDFLSPILAPTIKHMYITLEKGVSHRVRYYFIHMSELRKLYSIYTYE